MKKKEIELRKKLNGMSESVAKNTLLSIVLSLREGRDLQMNSSEILDGICSELIGAELIEE